MWIVGKCLVLNSDLRQGSYSKEKNKRNVEKLSSTSCMRTREERIGNRIIYPKIEVVGSEVSEKRVWVQRLAQMEKKAG